MKDEKPEWARLMVQIEINTLRRLNCSALTVLR